MRRRRRRRRGWVEDEEGYKDVERDKEKKELKAAISESVICSGQGGLQCHGFSSHH